MRQLNKILNSPFDAKRRWTVSVLLALIPASMLLLASPGLDIKDRYRRIHRWDAIWYASIAETGYLSLDPVDPKGKHVEFSPLRNNVGFFPGAPILTALTAKLFHLDYPIAGALSSQVAYVIMLFYLLSFLQRMGVTAFISIFMSLGIVLFPGSLFNVSGFAESPLLLGGMGMIYWLFSRHRYSTFFAILHGILATASSTRSAALLIVPALTLLFAFRKKRESALPSPTKSFCVGAGSLLGIAAFFTYCHFKFGIWNLYIQTQYQGWWQVGIQWLAPFKISKYAFGPGLAFYGGFSSVHGPSINRFMGSWMTVAVVVAFIYELSQLRKKPQRTMHQLFSSAALLALYFLLAAQDSSLVAQTVTPIYTMMRYGLPVVLMLGIYVALLFNKKPFSRTDIIRLSALYLLFFILEWNCAKHFVMGNWLS